jgi:hypothetical protein
VHVELFVNGLVVLFPSGIGRGPDCDYPLRTTEPTGLVEIAAGAGRTLGDLFAVWGQPLSRRRVCGFRSSAAVRVYVGGRRVDGSPRAVRLRRHAEIVVEIGPYVPPHRSYVFAGGKAATA